MKETENTDRRYSCDMHCHTVRSDGNDTPEELLKNAAAAGLKVVAITDHDTLPPLNTTLEDGSEVSLEVYTEQLGIQYVPGYEFSCDTDVDDVHICGYGLDWNHPALADEVGLARRSKSDAYEELCRRLGKDGIFIDWENDILRLGGPEKRCADDIERKHIFEAIAAKGYTPTWNEAKLLVRNNPELNVKRRKIDPVEAIKLIHLCGGIAILAHPYLIDEMVTGGNSEAVSRSEYIERLINGGLDGIEASYTYDKTSYKGNMSPEEIESEIRAFYGKRILISGGSDYHADHKKGNSKARSIGERGISIEEFSKIENSTLKSGRK